MQEFEDRFIKAHNPIEKTIKILCKECHRKYDSVKNVHEFIPETSDVREAAKLEKYEEEESKVIEKMVKADSIKKEKAIDIVNQKTHIKLTSSNTIFSNIIAADDEWWLEPHNDKFKIDLNIVLNDYKTETLYVFRLPANKIKIPSDYFKQRNDKYRINCSDIYIRRSATMFVDKKGFDFTSFLLERVRY